MLARAFFRRPEQQEFFAQTLEDDFERRKNPKTGLFKEPGISLFRLDLISEDEVLKRVKPRSKKNVGLAIIEAQVLRAFYYQFVTSADNREHISLRCPPCDLNLAMPPEELCRPKLNGCGFDGSLLSSANLSRLFQVKRAATA